MPDKKLDQAKYRRGTVGHDQFNRAWAQNIEISTGDPCGGNGIPFGWVDPLDTPNVYISVPRDGNKLPMMGHVYVDFDRWIKDMESSYRDWKAFLFQIGQKLFKKTTPAEVAEWEKDEYLLNEAGPKPGSRLDQFCKDGETPVDVLKRARDGDAELLGIDEYVPHKMKYQEFVAQARRQGKTMKEVGAGWAIYKKDLEQVGA